jgi:hypothetical protein
MKIMTIAIRPIRAMPPITPPTMAPMLVLLPDFLGDGMGFGEVWLGEAGLVVEPEVESVGNADAEDGVEVLLIMLLEVVIGGAPGVRS